MEALVGWLSGYSWWIYVATAVTIASAVMAVLPSTVKNSTWYNVAMKVVNMLALNIGKAKSKDDKTKIKISDQ